MSSVKISGNASGTGILTIAAPNTNTDRTLTLPDEAGTILTNANGLSYEEGTFTPSIISGANLGNGAITGSYTLVGDVMTINITFTLGSTSSVSAVVSFGNLPYLATSTPMRAPCMFEDSGTSYVNGMAIVLASTIDVGYLSGNNFNAPNASTPFTWTTNDKIAVNATYKVTV